MAQQTLRLILGDQLHHAHSWFAQVNPSVHYVMMETRSETDYTVHHIQKIAAFFTAMRRFADELRSNGHDVIYFKLNDKNNRQAFATNLAEIISRYGITHFEYQHPDEYRLRRLLEAFTETLTITTAVYDSEHFLCTPEAFSDFAKGSKSLLMENFYREMRRKHHILMRNSLPEGGQWNFDSENRKKLPKGHRPPAPLLFDTDVSEVLTDLAQHPITTMGSIDGKHFIWPTTRAESLQLLAFFTRHCLPLFGTFQDAMAPAEWSLYHSRLSFSMNTKMLSPAEVISTAVSEWEARPEDIGLNQLEGFVRQIVGWREYMRGIYWLKMPEFATLNFFNHKTDLPAFYWTGRTKMHCVRDAVQQSLTQAYAHHIQRLMITGNFALLAGIDPDQVDDWYLGIYIDAIEWVEITNTRGMSQFADGGLIGTKPYVSSAAYIDRMSHYCGTCFYDKSKKTGPRACPFNSLYWNFYDRHREKLSKNPRIGMVYSLWDKMTPNDKSAILEQAAHYLEHLDAL
ncbi:cryptochrome/photolyase family protein [Flavobacterium magnum]|uniref:Cryptochrome/photolyase family protein n=1 Tax=Flavobacterium magnum TaxID=2162713 RepID=A0A2S0RGM6_9FLAO|nr:cryptochrome/photolyase family protein [Flavobacterium magnum]AWA30913.1 cryptochrome/photolyase family protein [Flavobacterium magnum]